MKIQFLIAFLCVSFVGFSQSIKGKITNTKGDPIPFASVFIKDSKTGTTSDLDGFYQLKELPKKITILVSYQGFRRVSKSVIFSSKETKTLNFTLLEDQLGLEEVVVTATRNRVEKRKTPVIVSTIKPRLLQATQSISIFCVSLVSFHILL